MLIPLDEHQLLVFWTQLLVLVSVARLFGGLMRRINLPSVIGQLAAGIIVGPSIFGRVWPSGFEWFLPEEAISSGALLAVSWLGVALLLVTAGFETDLGLIRSLGRAAALVTGFSLVVPLLVACWLVSHCQTLSWASIVTAVFSPYSWPRHCRSRLWQ